MIPYCFIYTTVQNSLAFSIFTNNKNMFLTQLLKKTNKLSLTKSRRTAAVFPRHFKKPACKST